MVVLEPRPPVGRLEQGLQGASQVDKAVAHQEEHGEQRGDLVNVAWENEEISLILLTGAQLERSGGP